MLEQEFKAGEPVIITTTVMHSFGVNNIILKRVNIKTQRNFPNFQSGCYRKYIIIFQTDIIVFILIQVLVFSLLIFIGTLGTYSNSIFLSNKQQYFVFSVKQKTFSNLFQYLEYNLKEWKWKSISNQLMNAIVWKVIQFWKI